MNESRAVEERVTSVYSEADLKAELEKVWLWRHYWHCAPSGAFQTE